VLAEDLRLQEAMTVHGLPMRLRDELHVRSDRSGVALRRVLLDFRADGGTGAAPDVRTNPRTATAGAGS
jgi:hypothetical protein